MVRLAGEEQDGYMAVNQGLMPGDRVVLRPNEDLREGTRIQF